MQMNRHHQEPCCRCCCGGGGEVEAVGEGKEEGGFETGTVDGAAAAAATWASLRGGACAAGALAGAFEALQRSCRVFRSAERGRDGKRGEGSATSSLKETKNHAQLPKCFIFLVFSFSLFRTAPPPPPRRPTLPRPLVLAADLMHLVRGSRGGCIRRGRGGAALRLRRHFRQLRGFRGS